MTFDPTHTRALGRKALKLSCLGFGTAALGGLFRATSEQDAGAALHHAFALGLRYFDTAPQYGHGLAEHRLGTALRSVDRTSFVLSTKVGKLLRSRHDGRLCDGLFVGALPFDVVFDYSYDGTMRSIEDSCQRLGISRIDLIFIHDVNRKYHGADVDIRFHEAMTGAYRALDRLRSEGIIQAFGVGMNDWDISMRFAEAGDFDCFMLAGRYTLLNWTALGSFLPMCQRRQIGVLLASPLNSGILAGGSRGASFYDYAPAPEDIVEKVRQIEAICGRHNVPLAAAALQFPLLHPTIASVVVGMRSVAEVDANAALMRAAIPHDLWDELKNEGLLPLDAPTDEDELRSRYTGVSTPPPSPHEGVR
jgi:D-threo-aldose 1-dehydrogenase